MTIHTPACQTALAEFLSAAEDSVQYRIAHYVEEHEAPEGLDLLLTVLFEDAPETPEFVTAQRLLPSLLAEAVQS
ncbi:hypothetical protein OG874_00045 [Nocardia sp. NBC_00565]|uniref:hypothetical protein n=1 Tax=Nocardia sp. NBC_00565 TaxID=2975993 RepID=UPI002E80FFF7|nr:hypothetical protein [Nocardia sp. NBC_00565]WUC03644.1 hypothetical protein OG874_00045 [Nocardia sp. NBC_00565]